LVRTPWNCSENLKETGKEEEEKKKDKQTNKQTNKTISYNHQSLTRGYILKKRTGMTLT
jgi:hypothetical protein